MDEFSNATAVVNWRFQWLWLYGFVHPSTGETYWWILPFVNRQLFERVLADFARHWKVGSKKRVVLVVDGAGWHLSALAHDSFPTNNKQHFSRLGLRRLPFFTPNL